MTVEEHASALDADEFGALCLGPRPLLAPGPGSALRDVDFVVKDLFDVAGFPTGAGNPVYWSEHPQAERTAGAVTALVDAGARLIGKAHTDELAFSLSGIDSRMGSPRNPLAGDRIPGGSSSGSAVAVAARLVPLAVGTDTGGSVRVPASYCGLVGVRPTHGVVAVDGVVPLAPSFDTVGWFTRSTELARRVASVLLPPGDRARPDTLLLVDDAMAVLAPPDARAVREAVGDFAARAGLDVRSVALPGPGPAHWLTVVRTIQLWEAWEQHGAWMTSHPGALAPTIEARLGAGAQVTEPDVVAARAERERFVSEMLAVLPDRAAVVVPSAAGAAPTISAMRGFEAEAIRSATLTLTAPAGLLGSPAVSVPAARSQGLPLGVCLVGRPGDDLRLLDLAVEWEAVLAGPMP